MYEAQLLGNPVLSLQVMLRKLKSVYTYLPEVPLDGIFGETTLEAVLLFQRERFPPATGIVTQEVWNEIANEYAKHNGNIEKPRVLRAYPEEGDPLAFGEEGADIALFQLMFQAISEKISMITPEIPTGKFTETLNKNVKWLQSVAGLPLTGTLDRLTWDRLARLYEIYVTKL